MPLLHVKISGNKVSCQLLHTQEYWYMISLLWKWIEILEVNDFS